MAKKDYYIVEKNVNKIMRGEYTNFLDPQTLKSVISKLKGYDYKIYSPYEESEKKIIYTKKVPRIRLLEIISYNKLAHRNILGSLMALNINTELFGDIIITDEHAYIMIVNSIYNLIMNEFTMVGNEKIKIKEVSFNVLTEYVKEYDELELFVSSLRIDNVVSRIVGTSRDQVKRKFMEDEVILNYEVCHRLNYVLKENDIFSIRRYGKYKFGGITKLTNKNNFIIKCYKYK